MPALSVYIGAHNVSALVAKSSQDFAYYNYPYVYSKQAFSNNFTESEFYKAVFEQFCKNQKLKLSECDVFVTGFLEPPSLNFNLKGFTSVTELVSEIMGHFPVVVNNYSVLTKDGVYSCMPWSQEKGCFMELEPDEVDYYVNLSVYPQIVTNEVSSQIDLDNNIASLLIGKTIKINQNEPVVFMGSRFSQVKNFEELFYLLMVDLVRVPGIYDLRIDPANSLILTTLLNKFSKIKVDSRPQRVGTLVSTNGPIECMVTSQVGTSQIIELEKDRVFVVPVRVNETTRLLLKNNQTGETTEKQINGGRIGIIFDTRVDKKDLISNFKVFNDSLKVFNEVIGNI